MAPEPSSGDPGIDRYLAEGFDLVKGMSSRFSATVCGHLLRRQSSLGIAGGIAEIGTFEGRFFIALALGLQPGERAFGIDNFEWPDPGVEQRFHENCRRNGLDPARFVSLKLDSGTITPARLRELLGGEPIRLFHIDGDHSHEALLHDLALAQAVLAPDGIICLDDMLHPVYPFLVVTVRDWLVANPEMRLFCILDREDVVAAAKFLICRASAVPLYEDDLMASFPSVHLVLGGDALGHHCVVLTPTPRLAEV